MLDVFAHKPPPSDRRTVPTVSRPSLRITRHEDRPPPADVSFEVWNPFTTSYEPHSLLTDGLDRVPALATQIQVKWVQQDPARSSLRDPPDPADGNDIEWREFRVSFQANRVYDTRNFDQPTWKKAMSRIAAIETTCDKVGCVLP